ncbi:hypothetical protein H5410_045666 [Solanum commersonii]|uniref:Uncharacterized protein n=1 Tax=Solanum commersonii TaxID=4109 RepID=A0A9J5XEB6_SOLCO|nr:hypothetical protein H5410_045666 [Solanum commersonii]
MRKSCSPATQIATRNPSRVLSVLDRWRIETYVEIVLIMVLIRAGRPYPFKRDCAKTFVADVDVTVRHSSLYVDAGVSVSG